MVEKVIMLLVILPIIEGAIPGTFYWRPRLGIDLAVPTTESSVAVNRPTVDNVLSGVVVLVDGYQVGITVISLTAGISSAKTNPHLDPISSHFYTNAYRWGLRYFSLIPFWIGGSGGHFVETHKVWKRRFYYMDEFVPTWMRKLFPYVDKDSWDREEKEFQRFKKYSEPAFGKHYRYPTKVFRDYQSQITKETLETVEIDASSISDEFE